MSAQATADLAAYHELMRTGSYEFAVTMGREVLRKHPGSAAAAVVSKSLPEVEARAKAQLDRTRLAALWDFQTGLQSGGRQAAASIYSSQPGSAAERVRLILRRHSDWGESVYLFGSGAGFACASDCRLAIRYDDAPAVNIKAHLPETGEPAIFIDDIDAFLAKLEGAQRIEIKAALEGGGERTYVFEVAGFDAAKWPQL